MTSPLPQDAAQELYLARQQTASAETAFFEAWKRGVELAGVQWFGDGSREALQRATEKWDLCPKVTYINKTINVLSSGERLFLAALVSFYNSHDGGKLLKRCGFEGLSNFSGLDSGRTQVIADLLVNYRGW